MALKHGGRSCLPKREACPECLERGRLFQQHWAYVQAVWDLERSVISGIWCGKEGAKNQADKRDSLKTYRCVRNVWLGHLSPSYTSMCISA